MKKFSAISGLLLSFVIGLCYSAETVYWVPSNIKQSFTFDNITLVSPKNGITIIGRTSGVLDTKAKLSSIGKPSLTALGNSITALLGSPVTSDSTGRYQFPCDIVPQLPNLVFTLVGADFVFPPKQYVANGTTAGSCMTIFAKTPTTIVFNNAFVNYFKMRWDSIKFRIGFVQRF